MASFMDKIKGLLGGKKTSGEAGSGGSTVDTIKEQAGGVKDKVDELVDQADGKVPAKVSETYEKVSDKVEQIIPGDRHAGDATAADDAATPESGPGH
jgi:hypothetical protein